MSEQTTAQQAPRNSGTTTGSLFQTSPHPRVTFGTVVLFLLASILVFGGFYLMGAAFSFEEIGIWLFAAGLLVDTVGLWLVFGVIPGRD